MRLPPPEDLHRRARHRLLPHVPALLRPPPHHRGHRPDRLGQIDRQRLPRQKRLREARRRRNRQRALRKAGGSEADRPPFRGGYSLQNGPGSLIDASKNRREPEAQETARETDPSVGLPSHPKEDRRDEGRESRLGRPPPLEFAPRGRMRPHHRGLRQRESPDRSPRRARKRPEGIARNESALPPGQTPETSGNPFGERWKKRGPLQGPRSIRFLTSLLQERLKAFFDFDRRADPATDETHEQIGRAS